MNTYFFLQSFLTLHLTGLILMAGTTVIDSLMYRSFWKQFDTDKEKALILLNATAQFGRIGGIGAALLIITGFGMMILTRGIFGEQLWFMVKFGLVIVLIVINLVARRRGLKFRKYINGTNGDSLVEIASVKAFLNRYFLTVFAIFFLIILLSVFKFN